MSREHHISIKELGTNFIHESRLALLILPLFASDQHTPVTAEYAHEFADAFNFVILQEGKPAFSFINGLKKQEREKIINILKQGGMAGSVYMTGEDIFSVSDDPDNMRQDVQED